MTIKITSVALSTTGAEFIATTEAYKEMLWLKRLLDEIGFKKDQLFVHCNSESVIHLSKYSSFHSKSELVEV